MRSMKFHNLLYQRSIKIISIALAVSVLAFLLIFQQAHAAAVITAASTTIPEADPPNNGSIPATQVVTLVGDTFVASIPVNSITVNNLPAGLALAVTRNNDTQITISFSGNATNHANVNDVTNASVRADATALTLGAAATSGNFTFDFSDPAVTTKTQLGGACGTQETDCDRNLVCAPVEIDKRYMCRGSSDTLGCLNTFNSMSQADKDSFGVVTANDLCATGLVCNTVIDTVQGICANDFGGKKAAELKLGEDTTDIRNEINRVINIFLSFLAILGVGLIIYGGILWATAGGNDEQVGKARKTMIAAVIGLIIIAVAWTIISYVINLGDTLS